MGKKRKEMGLGEAGIGLTKGAVILGVGGSVVGAYMSKGDPLTIAHGTVTGASGGFIAGALLPFIGPPIIIAKTYDYITK